MYRAHFLTLVISLAAGLTASVTAKPATADPFAALLQQVVGAIGRDDLAAFDPLVARDRDFDWDASLGPLVARYQCPVVERCASTVLERGEGSARVRLEIVGNAEFAGPHTPAQLPRFWILELRRVDGRWFLGSLAGPRRAIARRVSRAGPGGGR